MSRDLPRCGVCDAAHDPRPCARDGAMCACCMTIYRTPEDRAALPDATLPDVLSWVRRSSIEPPMFAIGGVR